MTLRTYLDRLVKNGQVIKIGRQVSKTYEISGILKKFEPATLLFENVTNTPYRVVGNLFASKTAFSEYFGIPVNQIIPLLTQAIENRKPCPIVQNAPCQEFTIENPDLNHLPILRHCEGDGGNYISSGVFITKHPQYGQNMDFHRAMQFSDKKMAVRIVRNRHFDSYLQDLKKLDVAICIGLSPNILAAAAMSVDIGINELEIANALEQVEVVRCQTSDLLVPAESEFVIEGTIFYDQLHAEGPFVDLTETYDVIRQEPVFVVNTITHRKDPIWHALLPGALEHKLLMGMPREPTIFKNVNEVVKCLDVNVNPGGCSWLHAIVQIDKRSEDDGKKTIEAAFSGHKSCKHVFVVDGDVDIYNPAEIEWAMATRFQGDRDLVIKKRSAGSSLDPSADSATHITTRVGFDLTKPLNTGGKSYERAVFPEVKMDDIQGYLK
jgi:2,5-furandicarboxylate decarboxylase 1